MPQATKEAILAHIDKVVNAFNVEIAQADAPEDDKFRLMPDSEREKLLPKKVEKVAEKPKSETPKPIPTVKKQ